MLLVGLCFALTSCGECKHKNFSNEFEVVEPTCTEDGQYVYTCLDCGEKVGVAPTDGDFTMFAIGHDENRPTVTTQPTCTEPGVKSVTCKVCDAVVSTEAVAALGHEIDEDEYDFDANGHWNVCSREGCGAKSNEAACSFSLQAMDAQSHIEACVCGAVKTATEAAHSWTTGTVTKESSCSAVGYKSVECTECGYATSLEIEKTAHTFDLTNAKSDGREHWFACSVCDEEKPDSRETCTLGAAVVVAPDGVTCAPGTSTRTCSVCGNASVEAIPSSVAHTLSNSEFRGDTETLNLTCEDCGCVFAISGCATVNDFEQSGLTQYSPSSETAWKTSLIEGPDNNYVECLANEIFEPNVNGVNYRYSGPLMGLKELDYFIVTLDVMIAEGGLCGVGSAAPKDADGKWPGNLLLFNPDGSITTPIGEIASAGTLTKTSFTTVTFSYEAATGKLVYWVNGVKVLEGVSNNHVGKKINYFNLIIPAAKTEEDIGSGLCFDNIAYASGENAGVSLQMGSAE